MGEIIQVDFRPIKMQEVYDIAKRLHWEIRQSPKEPYFYRFYYIGDDVPLKEEHPRSFLVFNEKHTGNLMVEQVQITAAMYRCEVEEGRWGKDEPFAIRKFMNKINELDRTLRKELPFYGEEIELKRK